MNLNSCCRSKLLQFALYLWMRSRKKKKTSLKLFIYDHLTFLPLTKRTKVNYLSAVLMALTASSIVCHLFQDAYLFVHLSSKIRLTWY